MSLSGSANFMKMNHPVILAQMGKVGSKSIQDALERVGLDVVHLHHLDRFGNFQYPSPEVRGIKTNQYKISRARKAYEYAKSSDGSHIVSLVRDPIARNISAFFQDNSNISSIIDSKKELLSPSEFAVRYFPMVIDLLLENYNFRKCLTYFEDNFQRFLSVDIYSVPFDTSQHELVLSEKGINVLVLRLEDSDQVKASSIKRFLDIPPESIFTIEKVNSSFDKGDYVHALYKEVVKNIKFDEAFLEKIYSSRLVSHFYSASEVSLFTNRWSSSR